MVIPMNNRRGIIIASAALAFLTLYGPLTLFVSDFVTNWFVEYRLRQTPSSISARLDDTFDTCERARILLAPAAAKKQKPE